MASKHKEEIRRVLDHEAGAIRSIPISTQYDEVVELIFEKVHQKGGKIIASGMGKAGHVANHMATTLSSTGTPSLFLHPSEAQHGDLGIIRQNDILLVLSNSGKTREILESLTRYECDFTSTPRRPTSRSSQAECGAPRFSSIRARSAMLPRPSRAPPQASSLR